VLEGKANNAPSDPEPASIASSINKTWESATVPDQETGATTAAGQMLIAQSSLGREKL
jgi:hypothetical protein